MGIHASANDSSLVAYAADRSGKFRFIDLRNAKTIDEADAGTLAAEAGKIGTPRTLLGATACGPEAFTLRWSDGVISLVRLNVKTELAGKSLTTPKFTLESVATLPADKLGVPEQAVMYRTGEDEARSAALYGGQKIVVTRQTADLSGDKTETKIVLDPELPDPVTAIAMSRDGKWLYAGTAGGSLLWWELGDDKWIDHDVAPPSRDKTPITSLGLMLGDITLVAGDAAGNVTNWFFVNATSDRPQQAGGGGSKARPDGMVKEAKKLTYIRSLEPQHAAVDAITPSPRNRAVLIGDRDGQTSMDYTTSERRLLTLDGVSSAAFGSRGDVFIGLAGDRIKAWRVEGSLWGVFKSQLYPEVSWESLCGRVWYEGHGSPDFSWQPQGSEESEPKISLIPLVFGTFKGTFYAMLLAAPLAPARRPTSATSPPRGSAHGSSQRSR